MKIGIVGQSRYVDLDKIPFFIGTDAETGEEMMLTTMSQLEELPTADVEEVRHGEWKEHCANGYWHYDCLFCDDGYAMKEKDKTPPKYCSNCGAKMDGERRANNGT